MIGKLITDYLSQEDYHLSKGELEKKQEEYKVLQKKIDNSIHLGLFLVVLFLVAINCFTCVQQRERGVLYRTGIAKEVLQPGIALKFPIVDNIVKYSIAPKTFEVRFDVGEEGAITKDMQTVGTIVNVKYAFDENRIMDIAKRYGDSVVESAMKSNIIASIKEVVGKYSIYELIEKQPEVTDLIAKSILARMTEYPIVISQTTIQNWDWSDDFDRQIKETSLRTQQVKQKEQEANIAAAEAQIQVRQAEAKKQAIQLESEAALIKAQNEAKAKEAEADGIAYYNQKIAQNMVIQQAQWKHDETMAYNEKWDGHLVPQYVPLTAAGGIVTIPGAK